MIKRQTLAAQALDLPERYLDGTEGLRGVSVVVEPATTLGSLVRNHADSSTTVGVLARRG